MVITSDNLKHNLGLSMKFEAKSLKVVDYSRKEGRHWEFSDKAIQLLQEYQTAFPDIFNCLDIGGDGVSFRMTSTFC
jgi:5'-3' exoribonuclease 1